MSEYSESSDWKEFGKKAAFELEDTGVLKLLDIYCKIVAAG